MGVEHIVDITGRAAPGLPFTPAVVVDKLVFCAGQVGFRPGTSELVQGGIEEQTRQAMENLSAILMAAGSSLEQIVKTLVFLADPADFPAFNRTYASFFRPQRYPARSTVQTGFVAPGVLVEIECVAVRPDADALS